MKNQTHGAGYHELSGGTLARYLAGEPLRGMSRRAWFERLGVKPGQLCACIDGVEVYAFRFPGAVREAEA